MNCKFLPCGLLVRKRNSKSSFIDLATLLFQNIIKMRYIIIPIGYLIAWCYLLPYLILERTIKIISVIYLVLWNLNLIEDWMFRFEKIDFIIPIPLIGYEHWQINNCKNYFMMKKENWKIVKP